MRCGSFEVSLDRGPAVPAKHGKALTGPFFGLRRSTFCALQHWAEDLQVEPFIKQDHSKWTIREVVFPVTGLGALGARLPLWSRRQGLRCA